MAKHLSPNSKLAACRELHVPVHIVSETLEELRRFGASGCEGLVLWVGRISGPTAEVTRALVPPQHPIREEGGVGYFVEGTALFQLNRNLLASGQRLLAQIHSHPGLAYHSETDDRYAIVTEEGGFSLVVPNFGRAPPELTAWANYRLQCGTWTELTQSQVRRTLFIRN